MRDDRPCAGTAASAVLYCYSPDRKGEHPRAYLAAFHGIRQVEGYQGYAGLYERGVTEAACWAHARRKFFDEHAGTKSPLALEALQRIAALYRVEAMVCGQSADFRLMTRPAKITLLCNDLKVWLERTLAPISGKSDLAAAIRYTLSRWQALTLMLRDGRVCIDNNAAERAMRPMCRRQPIVRPGARASRVAGSSARSVMTAAGAGSRPRGSFTRCAKPRDRRSRWSSRC